MGYAVRGTPARLLLCAVHTAVCAAIALLIVSNYRVTKEYDLRSARIRDRIQIGGIILRQQVRETALTRLLFPRGYPAGSSWVTVSSSTRLERSPHYQYGGVEACIREFELISEYYDLSAAQKTDLARCIMGLLRAGRLARVAELLETRPPGRGARRALRLRARQAGCCASEGPTDGL